MEPQTTQIVSSAVDVSQMLAGIRQAFAEQQIESGTSLMERALALNVSWEALTHAVGEGIDAARVLPADS